MYTAVCNKLYGGARTKIIRMTDDGVLLWVVALLGFIGGLNCKQVRAAALIVCSSAAVFRLTLFAAHEGSWLCI